MLLLAAELNASAAPDTFSGSSEIAGPTAEQPSPTVVPSSAGAITTAPAPAVRPPRLPPPAPRKPGELLLTGGVQHSDSLPSFDERFRPGKQYLPLEGLVEQRKTGIWYKIPPWMAAHIWHSETRTEYYWQDLTTGKVKDQPYTLTARADQSQGWQTDARGDIWQYSAVPFVTKTDGDYDFTVHFVTLMEPVEITENRFVKRSRAVQIEVGKRDNVIRKVEQDEQIHIFTPISDGVLRCEDSSKVFDMDGNAIRLEKAYEVQVRTQDYAPVDIVRGMNVKANFYVYLTEHGMSDLIPGMMAIPQ